MEGITCGSQKRWLLSRESISVIVNKNKERNFFSVRQKQILVGLKGNQVEILSDPVAVNEEQSCSIPLHGNVRRCGFVRSHKPGDLLKRGKLLPMKAYLHEEMRCLAS